MKEVSKMVNMTTTEKICNFSELNKAILNSNLILDLIVNKNNKGFM
jgi:hypothetical protein